MATTFEIATRAALEEIVTKHAQESKFGYIVTKESLTEMVDDLFTLLQTSRTLKSAGDKFLRNASAPAKEQPTPRRPHKTT